MLKAVDKAARVAVLQARTGAKLDSLRVYEEKGRCQLFRGTCVSIWKRIVHCPLLRPTFQTGLEYEEAWQFEQITTVSYW